ncbi:zinc finger with UFM1-specific peptidase domain protein isoform X1 [Xiphophorus maculatus]|uniref:Zinc finger-containing ubiquitin peptidase 1 n=2 Tax=Xiphophorus maculatus TaxID=8083 RepID=A0A3B5QYB7_XIPMA|nr:zinc finger with UFM1-specific peptidase domain protein isoform X1 [Xiphophorus maculatus]XP_023186343.1 zinc finger with UFM1-specific peptidase domain protein isoform X1 [Xiphophorus maculatus]XP_023186344.1 zinc finger with UFM1-specific peptidase domain protein isoform X1 [Xiphophorus maculatus]XP_023186345.1 zinc finger with UFM1-specific peptidase domain protein isoform X1 [Xiphophorus maculatus]
MLTCEICGEEILLEEDMKTHLFLCHLENDLHCPLRTLSGVDNAGLYFHIKSAHSGEQQIIQDPTRHPCGSALSDRTKASRSEAKESQTCQSLRAVDQAGRLTSNFASAVNTEHQYSSPGDYANSTAASKTQVAEISDQNNVNVLKDELHQTQPLSAEKLFSCPMCPLVFSCDFLLQEHVELHLLGQHSGQRSFQCPMCSAVYSNSFCLQEHVELHFDHELSRDQSGSPHSDLMLAKELQHKEELKRKQEQAQLERQEFKKLQRQFGLDGRGGYRRQMERSMERAVASGHLAPVDFHLKKADMMESLASGVDDGSSRTQGVIRALGDYYQTECRDSVQVWLAVDTDHYSSSAGDKGWGCGYRNFQMLLSSLHRIDAYSSVLQEKTIPCIPRVQRMIEEAWKEGLDPQGASHFSKRLQRTQAWIGGTEMYVLLTSLGISARIIDFHQPTGSKNTHPHLFDWVKQYFCQSSKSSSLSPRLILTHLPPLYLQHQGHSRTVVGLEQRKNGSLCLLLLDPGSSSSDTRKLLSRETRLTAVQFVRKFPRNLKHKQYQLIAVQGVLSPEEKQIRIFNSRTLSAERTP